MGIFDSFTIDELREIVDPDQPETLQQQAEGWGKMAELLREYSLLLEERLEIVEDSWTGNAATLYFDEVRRVQDYIEDSAERATINSVLWCAIATLAGIAKHDVSYIHTLWKELDTVTDAVGLGFILEALGLDVAFENLKRLPYDQASRQIMDLTMTAAQDSYAQMQDFEDFDPPPNVGDTEPSLQSVYPITPSGGALPAPPIAATPSPFTPVVPIPVVSPVIGSRPGTPLAARPMMRPGATVKPVIGQRAGGAPQTKATRRLIGRDGVIRATPDVDLRDPKAHRVHYGDSDVNRGVIKNTDPQHTADKARLKLEEEVLRLRERAYVHRAEALSADHSQQVLPGIVGNDSEWARAKHEPGPVIFGVRRRHGLSKDDNDNGWTVF